ncbi:methyltransferase domain-containing protein [Sulfitobacter aestuariivivens]
MLRGVRGMWFAGLSKQHNRTKAEFLMLQFDAETTAILENGYLGADVTARRRASFDALGPLPGETILDLGCGNGLLTLDLARAVGPQGRVIGVDPSADMLNVARKRLEGFDNIALEEGLADALPLADAQIDRAVSVQVFEYIDDRIGALTEIRRVLKPGGVAVVADMNFDMFSWVSDDAARMDRMKTAWDSHLAERDTGALLPAEFRAAGFAGVEVVPFTIVDPVLRPDGLAQMMMILMRRYAIENDLMPAAEANAWYDEQVALAAEGRFFFSLAQMVVSGRKP